MMLVTSSFTIFQHASLDVENDGVCTGDIPMYVRNSYVRVHCKFGLEEEVNNNQVETAEPTLKT
jgi:hypothetical protein